MAGRVHGSWNGQAKYSIIYLYLFRPFFPNQKEKRVEMGKRMVSIWFRHLKTDWLCRRHPKLRSTAFVLAAPDHGRLVITESSPLAQEHGIERGMVLADARALISSLQVFDDNPKLPEKILHALAGWCIRYTNIVTVDPPEGLKLDVTGCAHLWGGEKNYIRDINLQLKNLGYDVRAVIADTVGAAWAIAHYGEVSPVIEPGEHRKALLRLPVSALRLKTELIERLQKLGLRQIKNIDGMPRSAMIRRFGPELMNRLAQAFGDDEEILHPVFPAAPYRERLPCLEPIVTSTGIEIALQRLLDAICMRLQKENKGIRKAVFTGYRIDGKIEKIEIGTHRATFNSKHLFKLFEIKISTIEPALGIDLFMLEALKTEKLSPRQEILWESVSGLLDIGFSELMDRLTNRFGPECIHRYVPAEHHWPERSFRNASSLLETAESSWKADRPRPLHLLSKPQPVEVTAPIPDYPPMLFRYQGQLHTIKKADGPERIEKEWWIEEGLHRDYYAVEDDEGRRYWIFRSGHYSENMTPLWFIHGFFA
jgi:protein ImuB